MVDVLFRLSVSPPGLYAARLDLAVNTNLSSVEWFRHIRPFSFSIEDITRQRGGVSILNNVINPTKGEQVYVNYYLERSGQVTVQVFTLDGNLVQSRRHAGTAGEEYVFAWNGRNRNRGIVARGMYLIRVVAPDIDEIRKVMVVK
jgi:hypothetical protein